MAKQKGEALSIDKDCAAASLLELFCGLEAIKGNPSAKTPNERERDYLQRVLWEFAQLITRHPEFYGAAEKPLKAVQRALYALQDIDEQCIVPNLFKLPNERSPTVGRTEFREKRGLVVACIHYLTSQGMGREESYNHLAKHLGMKGIKYRSIKSDFSKATHDYTTRSEPLGLRAITDHDGFSSVLPRLRELYLRHPSDEATPTKR